MSHIVGVPKDVLDSLILKCKDYENTLEKIKSANCPNYVAHPQSVWWGIHVQELANKVLLKYKEVNV